MNVPTKTIHKIYIAGPMRGYPHFNFPAFNKMAAELRQAGYYVFNPAEADLDEYGNLAETNPTGSEQQAIEDFGFDRRKTMAKDCEFICLEADAIVMLKGWEESSGATAEHALAKALGLHIIYQN